MDFKDNQLLICQKYGAPFVDALPQFKIGISKNIKEKDWPINGLRHPIKGDTTGWYIWAGEEFSLHPDFFVPIHVDHLKEWCPIVIKYLGLAPGWRFLITETYEDVWEDVSLLNID